MVGGVGVRCLALGVMLVAGIAPSRATAGDEAAPAPARPTLEVTEIVLAKGIERGRPVDAGTSFGKADGKLFCVIGLRNPSREPSRIVVSFPRADGAGTDGVTLEVPGQPRYRTTARSGTAREPGKYKCVVRDAAGTLLAEREYDITE